MSRPTPPVDDRLLASARLLTDLVTNPLDGGYRAAHERRHGDTRRRWYDRPLVALGCLMVGFVVVVAYVRTNRAAPAAARVHQRLVERVRTAEHSGDALAASLGALQRRLAAAQAQALPAGGTLAARLRSDESAAGELALQGPGLQVTLRDPKQPAAPSSAGRGGTVPIVATNILTDRDVRSVVNELWADGAEAIAVNGVRLTPTSAVRFAGDAVLVDFQPISSPYRIVALGHADALSTRFAESTVAGRYQTRAGVEHFGFSFADSTALRVPAGVAGTPKYATVPSPSPSRRPK